MHLNLPKCVNGKVQVLPCEGEIQSTYFDAMAKLLQAWETSIRANPSSVKERMELYGLRVQLDELLRILRDELRNHMIHVNLHGPLDAQLSVSDIDHWDVNDSDEWYKIDPTDSCVHWENEKCDGHMSVSARILPPTSHDLENNPDLERFGRAFPLDIGSWESKSEGVRIVPRYVAFTRPQGQSDLPGFPYTYLIYQVYDRQRDRATGELKFQNFSNPTDKGFLTGKLNKLLPHTPSMNTYQTRLVQALFPLKSGVEILKDFKELVNVGPVSYRLVSRKAGEAGVPHYTLEVRLNKDDDWKESSFYYLLQRTDSR